jgi:selenocysteine lyase/cysteine desulfurase
MVMDSSSFISTFEPGNIDTLNFGSLLFSINLISKIGIGNIEKTIKKLSNYAKERFVSYDLLEKKILKRKDHSNIFNLKGNDLLHKKLIKKNIICSKRGDGIRVSFSFLNKKKEIDMLTNYFN